MGRPSGGWLPCTDTWTLLAALRSLWEHPFPKVRQVGVVLYDLVPDGQWTPSLFGEDAARRTASRAVDEINRRFGRGTLSMASVVPVRGAAEDKIAFGKIGGDGLGTTGRTQDMRGRANTRFAPTG